MQTAERRAVAGASETAGSLVFRPRERPPTQRHQAPGLDHLGAAEPKSLSRLLPNNGDRAIITKSLRVHMCPRTLLAGNYRKAVIPALHMFCISQNFLRGYTTPHYDVDGHHKDSQVEP
jgi:hypothetical protein